jgi:TonB-linked SusC/RagA family outer membrane protein
MICKKDYGTLASILFLSLVAVQPSLAVPNDDQALETVNATQSPRHTVRGVVKDSAGAPVIGASVVVVGTTTGTITDENGAFYIDAPANSSLQFELLGFQRQTVAVGNRSTIEVTLAEDAQSVDEVVVVGYGTMRKSDVTGSIASAKGSDMIKTQSFNALDGLKGKAAGVNIFSNTGQPGGEMRVIIRGVSTINNSVTPLYVVDGVVMYNMQLLNPNDIESVEVLKDSSSAAIYGARGANGVIMITTKRGGKNGNGKAVLSYDGSISIGRMQRYIDVMDSNEWMAAFKQGLENANRWQGTNFDTDMSKIFTDERLFDSEGNPLYNTDWQREASRTAVSHNHQLSIQRSADDMSVGAFLNYTDQQGVLKNTYMKRVNAKLAYDDKPVKWLSTGINLLVNHSWGSRTSDNPYGQGALRTMIEQLPFLPVMIDGHYSQTDDVRTADILVDKNDTSAEPDMQGFSPEGMGNPVELLERVYDMKYRTQIFGNAAITFHLTKDLTLRTQYGIDYHNNRDAQYEPFKPRTIISKNAEGRAYASNSNRFYWQEETYLNWAHDFGRHRVTAMAGMSWQENQYTQFDAADTGYNDDYLAYFNMGSGKNRPSVSNDHDRWAMNSYFMRGTYNYDDKYMATVTARLDGSSKFGENNKFAFFPSIGVGWMMSNEDFLKDNPVINRLKLRTALGVTGNQEISTYQSLQRIGQSNTIIGNSLKVVSYVSNLGNNNLRWEGTRQWDMGVEMGLWKNLLSFEFSYFYKTSSNLLLGRPVPESTGFGSMTANVGKVSNRGIDLLVTVRPFEGRDFQWTSTINMGYNKNRVEKLDPSSSVDPITGKRYIVTDGFVGYDMLIREGEELSTYYGYKRAGIYDGIPENWDPETMNIPGTIGEKVTYKERQILGHGLPHWMGSFVNTFNYKNFDLTLDLQFTWGVDLMQEYFHSTEARFLTSGIDRIWQEAWHPELNPTGKAQALRLNNFGMGANNQADDTWVCNGAYLRGNLIQIGYTFKPEAAATIGLSSLRIYGSVNNAFLITSKDYMGYDPDNSSRLDGNNWGANRQFFTYPRPRTFTFGVSAAF